MKVNTPPEDKAPYPAPDAPAKPRPGLEQRGKPSGGPAKEDNQVQGRDGG